MEILVILLLIAGAILFLIAIPPTIVTKINPVAAGLFCWILAALIEHAAGHVALH